MIRTQEKAVRSAVLGEVRAELEARKPGDGYRPYDAPRVSEDVRAAFRAVAEGKPDTAVIDVGSVVDAYATGLKESLGAVNTRGPRWLTAKEAAAVEGEQRRGRVTALRAELARGQRGLSIEALDRLAARFVADHSAPIGDSGNAIDVLFPAYDVGNGASWDNREPGISARLFTDAKSSLRILKMLLRDASPAEKKRLETFDPKKELLIVVRDSDDETKWYPAAIDKATGKARGFDSLHNEVSFAAVESKADFEEIFGRGSAARVSEDDLESAFYDRMSALFDSGRALPIEKLDPPGLDKEALTRAAAPAVEAYLGALRELPATLDLTPDQRGTLEAIRAALADGQHITIGESYGDPILEMPRKFAGAPLEEYHVGWAFSELTRSIPELKRFYNVNATARRGG